jgi:2-haloacid dehalogenase
MPSSLPSILFDFGNVLVQWDVHRIFERFFPTPAAIDSFLKEINYAEWNQRLDAGLPFAQGVAEHSAKFPQYARILQAYNTDWRKGVAAPIHGTVDILKRLKQAGYPLYVLSNFSTEKFVHMRAEYDWVSLFNDVILSGEHHLIKPDPAFFQAALQRIGRSAQECLFIDDHLPNIESARKLGLASIHFQSPAQLEMELKTLRIL